MPHSWNRFLSLGLAPVARTSFVLALLAVIPGIAVRARADPPASTAGDAPRSTSSTSATNVGPLSNSPMNRAALDFEKAFPYLIGFEKYQKPWSAFANGDSIAIKAIRGNRQGVEIGGTYAVLGTYTLASMNEAALGLFTTIRRQAGMPSVTTPVRPGQMKHVHKGGGTFVLWYTVTLQGEPHVSFYPDYPHAPSRGGVYFAAEPLFNAINAVKAGHVEIGEPVFKDYLDGETIN